MYAGLSQIDAEKRLTQYGYNEIPEKKDSFLKKCFHKFLSPISFMLLAAALLSFFVNKIFDCYFILLLLVLNVVIALWQEGKADDAIEKLNKHLAQKIKVQRDNKWQFIDSRLLVPDDLIQLSSGEVIPADGVVIEAKHVSVNESALSGESLPKDKNENDKVFSGAFVVTGIITIRVTATGGSTSFGKTIFSVERVRKRSLLEKDVISISKFLTILSLIAVGILSIVFLIQKVSILELFTLDLSLVIAGIPISLPTVMTLIIELGVLSLATKKVIVRRLSALEDLANVNFLLTDKTGTLTKNKITVQDIYSYDKFTHISVLEFASKVASVDPDNSINKAIIEKAQEQQVSQISGEQVDFIPADSERKRSTLVLKSANETEIITIGAPQIVEKCCSLHDGVKKEYENEIMSLAKNGYRVIAVAVGKDKTTEKDLQLVGLLALSDTLRPEAKSVIEFLKENNIGVAMVTGDNRAIASQMAKELALDDGKVVTKEELDHLDAKNITKDFYYRTGAFAEILPEDKFKLVEKAKQFFVVASNGDGVNDLPALKVADVGIAVKTAVTALKSTADIVLLSDGISVIRDAIIESRKIFSRIYTYSLYRISESLRLIVTIAILGIMYKVYPLTALQIIIVALLNDIPIISLAFDNVKITHRPAKINVKERFLLSSAYGVVGVLNSLFMFFIVKDVLHFNWAVIQTIYFLKLTVSGHLLIYVAHTKEKWYTFLPSKEVIIATTVTQLIATILALTGILMPGRISFGAVLFVWAWAFIWMQVSEVLKMLQQRLLK